MEAQGFDPNSGARPESEGARATERGVGLILVADVNAETRIELETLLGSQWRVESYADGGAALEAAFARPPDLVLAETALPTVDGFALIRELRGDLRTKHIPVILLSSRNTEDAVVEGLTAGADDY